MKFLAVVLFTRRFRQFWQSVEKVFPKKGYFNQALNKGRTILNSLEYHRCLKVFLLEEPSFLANVDVQISTMFWKFFFDFWISGLDFGFIILVLFQKLFKGVFCICIDLRSYSSNAIAVIKHLENFLAHHQMTATSGGSLWWILLTNIHVSV